jgi:hypothetical protein
MVVFILFLLVSPVSQLGVNRERTVIVSIYIRTSTSIVHTLEKIFSLVEHF